MKIYYPERIICLTEETTETEAAGDAEGTTDSAEAEGEDSSEWSKSVQEDISALEGYLMKMEVL